LEEGIGNRPYRPKCYYGNEIAGKEEVKVLLVLERKIKKEEIILRTLLRVKILSKKC